MKTSFKRKLVFCTGALLAIIALHGMHANAQNAVPAIMRSVASHVIEHANPNMRMAMPEGTVLVLQDTQGRSRTIITQGTSDCPDTPLEQCWVWGLRDTQIDVAYVDMKTRQIQKETWRLVSENGRSYIRTAQDEFVRNA